MNSARPDDKLEAGVLEAVRHEEPPLPSGSEPELLQPQYKPSVYQWSVRLFTLVRRMLGVNIKLHGPVDWIRQGDIFLFNHFARFETFIPQYLIHIETGDYCRSVASHEFFAGQDRFANYLLNVGAVPNDHPNLLAFLGAEILRGRKVVVFPEGGMVKDRRVQDESGDYTVYSRSAERRRPHHSGAAVLALSLARFKRDVLARAFAGDAATVNRWARQLGLGAGEALIRAARRPTRIVPANITFFPLGVDSNLLRRGAALMGRGLSPRALEELLVEGHLLLRYTDMDIRLGRPIEIREPVPSRRRIGEAAAYASYFEAPPAGGWWQRLTRTDPRHRVARVRDDYMQRIYAEVTVNLSHLSATLIFALIDAGKREIDYVRFCRMLYLSVKYCQDQGGLALHRSLKNPEAYRDLPEGQCPALAQFIEANVGIGLLQRDRERLCFLDRLCEEHAFDRVRLDNPIIVCANEVAPRRGVAEAVARAMAAADALAAADLALLRFDDELAEYEWDRFSYSKPRHARLNAAETATADPRPYLLRGDPERLGVVLSHGLLASPAELRPLAERLHGAGYTVLGVRLKGHGTSPWDLNDRAWTDWMASLQRARSILQALCPGVALVGFSTGGTLSLRLAAEPGEAPPLGVATVAAAMSFRDRRMALVPLVHNVHKLMRWVASTQGMSKFYPNDPEYPDINYRHIPVRALWELRRLVESTRRYLPQLVCPLRVVQGDADPVIDPDSGREIETLAGSEDKTLQWVHADWHGIARRDPGEVAVGLLGTLHQWQQRFSAGKAGGA